MSVATFTVHEPLQPQADRVDRADELCFVKDGFSWITAICPPLGFALKGLWTPALAYVVFVSALVALLAILKVSPDVVILLVAALNLFLGFEASSLQRWSLDNDSWRMIGTVTGRNVAECERRFFENWLPAQPVISAPATASRRGHMPGWPSGAKG